MVKSKEDPRILRTRKLILDAFIDLSSKKEFKDITVKDITNQAMINRATFYYHFEDIYDLLEKALSEVLLINLNGRDFENEVINEAAIIKIFLSITNFQESLSNRCHRGYEHTIARIIRDQLEVLFFHMLRKQYPDKEEKPLKITAAYLSWGIYGASEKWRMESNLGAEDYIKCIIPYILCGLGD